MSFERIPEQDVEVGVKAVVPAWRDPEKTKELLGRLSNVKVYGLLLSADPKSALEEVITTRWNELHHLSGEEFAVVAFDTPKEWSPAIRDYWRRQLGDDASRVWADWKKGRGLEAGAAFDWRDQFHPPLSAKDLPCLVLFTDLQSTQAVVRSIPDWDADAIYRFLMTQFDAVRECCAKPDNERLKCLRTSVGSTGTKLRTYMEHYAENAWRYLQEHPTTIAMTSVSLLIALGTANVIPITATGLGVLKALKDVFGKKDGQTGVAPAGS